VAQGCCDWHPGKRHHDTEARKDVPWSGLERAVCRCIMPHSSCAVVFLTFLNKVGQMFSKPVCRSPVMVWFYPVFLELFFSQPRIRKTFYTATLRNHLQPKLLYKLEKNGYTYKSESLNCRFLQVDATIFCEYTQQK
jgi:hypothetical protein